MPAPVREIKLCTLTRKRLGPTRVMTRYYFNMATVMAQGGDWKDAIDEYTRSIYINPISNETYNALGSIFLQQPEIYGKVTGKLFKQCLVIYPRNKDIWNNLGYIYTKQNMKEEASQAYKKALEIDPDFELAKRNVKATLNKLGKTDKALDESEALFSNIEKSIQSKNWQAALKDAERLVKVMSGSFKARFYLANIYFTIGRLDDAALEYQECVKLEPGNPPVWGNLGLLYMELKQFDKSRASFNKVLELNP